MIISLKANSMYKKNIATALIVAMVVGTVLNLINNYDVLLGGKFSNGNTLKVVLTYITPFCVSLYSSLKASRQKI